MIPQSCRRCSVGELMSYRTSSGSQKRLRFKDMPGIGPALKTLKGISEIDDITSSASRGGTRLNRSSSLEVKGTGPLPLVWSLDGMWGDVQRMLVVVQEIGQVKFISTFFYFISSHHPSLYIFNTIRDCLVVVYFDKTRH